MRTKAKTEASERRAYNDLANRQIDDDKWEAAYAYIRANNEWRKAHQAYGPFSTQATEAYEEAMVAQKRYNRVRMK